MFWTYRVANWEGWVRSLKFTNEEDEHARERRDKYGMVRRSIYRSVDDPNEVMLVAEFRTREGAEALLQDPEGMRRWHERGPRGISAGADHRTARRPGLDTVREVLKFPA